MLENITQLISAHLFYGIMEKVHRVSLPLDCLEVYKW